MAEKRRAVTGPAATSVASDAGTAPEERGRIVPATDHRSSPPVSRAQGPELIENLAGTSQIATAKPPDSHENGAEGGDSNAVDVSVYGRMRDARLPGPPLQSDPRLTAPWIGKRSDSKCHSRWHSVPRLTRGRDDASSARNLLPDARDHHSRHPIIAEHGNRDAGTLLAIHLRTLAM